METNRNATEIVLSYVKALDQEDYDNAAKFLSEDVRIIGPAGESFGIPGEFIDMLRHYHGRYKIKKTFTNEKDVCLLYDLITPAATVFMCSWYLVNNGKIASIQTIFDSGAFGPSSTRKGD